MTPFSLMRVAQTATETRRHSNGWMDLTPSVLPSATYGEWLGCKEPDPSPSKVNSEAQIIFCADCCFRNELFTKKKQVNIFRSLLFLDIEQA